MSHPFGDQIAQHLHRKHGLSQSKLAAGILQSPSVITDMCQGKRLRGPQARQRVTAIIGWLQQQGALATLDEANALLTAAGLAPLQEGEATEVTLIQQLHTPPDQNPLPSLAASRNGLLATPHAPRHNLPPQFTPFIGRTDQITHLIQQVQTRRLLTLTGAGGVGKTRLALEVANRLLAGFSDGIWFVDLAPLTDPAALPQRVLDLWRVPEQPERSPLEMLTTYLHSKQALLILDNCEHLLDACAALTETLLQQCPHLSLLSTSREALNIQAELPWRVPSLTRPRFNSNGNSSTAPVQAQSTLDVLAQFEAVALFVERAHLHQAGFALTTANAPAIAHICSRLDGIPLALEMAAARVNAFTVEELATQLDGAFDRRFQLLTSGVRTAPFRHQTLRATLEWSYNLLTPAERQLLRRLSIFTGGWTAAATEAVTGCSLALLAQLINKSLVIADQQVGQTRYRLLETVRQFAAEQLAVNEQERGEAQRQHSRYYLHLLSAQEERLQSQQQRTALDLLGVDFANISTAWQWAVDRHEFTLLAPAVHALFLFCEIRGSYRTGIALLTVAAAKLAAALTNRHEIQPVLAQVLGRIGACEVMLDNSEITLDALQQALGYATTDQERAFALAHLGHAEILRGETSLGIKKVNESLALSRQGGDLRGEARARHVQIWYFPDLTEAIHLCEESLALWRKVGRPDRIAEVLTQLAWHMCCRGNYELANAYWKESMTVSTMLEMQNTIAWSLDTQAWAAWCQGDLATAQEYLQDAAALYRAMGSSSGVAMCQAKLALFLCSAGDMSKTVQSVSEAVALVRNSGDQMGLILSLYCLGAVLIGAGDGAAARRALTESIQRAWTTQHLAFLLGAFYYFAELLVQESHAANLPDSLDRQALAFALLSCVRVQHATWQIFKDKAAQLQTQIESALPAEVCAAAIARGKSSTLAEMVNTLLG